ARRQARYCPAATATSISESAPVTAPRIDCPISGSRGPRLRFIACCTRCSNAFSLRRARRRLAFTFTPRCAESRECVAFRTSAPSRLLVRAPPRSSGGVACIVALSSCIQHDAASTPLASPEQTGTGCVVVVGSAVETVVLVAAGAVDVVGAVVVDEIVDDVMVVVVVTTIVVVVGGADVVVVVTRTVDVVGGAVVVVVVASRVDVVELVVGLLVVVVVWQAASQQGRAWFRTRCSFGVITAVGSTWMIPGSSR